MKPKQNLIRLVIVIACAMGGGAALVNDFQTEQQALLGGVVTTAAAGSEVLHADEAYRQAQSTIVLTHASWDLLFTRGR